MRKDQLKQTVGDPTVDLFSKKTASGSKGTQKPVGQTTKPAVQNVKPVFKAPPQAVDLAEEKPVAQSTKAATTAKPVEQPAVPTPERIWKPQMATTLTQRSDTGLETTIKTPETERKTASQSNDTSVPSLKKPVMTKETLGQNLTNWVNTWQESSDGYFEEYNTRFGNRRGDLTDAYVADSQEYLDTVNQRAQELQTAADSIRRSLEQYGSNLNPEWVLAVNQLLDERLEKHEQVKQTAARDAQYWAQFQDEDAYKGAQQHQKMLDTNLKVLSVELQQFERKVEAARQVQSEIAAFNPHAYASSAEALAAEKALKERLAGMTKEWGGMQGMEAELSQKQQYLVSVERFQTLARLESVVNNADFKKMSYTPVTDDDWFNTEKDVYRRFVNMTEEEKAIFNYYFNTVGEDAAEEYYDSIVERLNYRQAEIDYQQIKGHTLLEIEQGLRTGFDQFLGGVKGAWNTLTGNESYVPTSTAQYLGSMAREGLGDNGFKIFGNSLGQMAYDLMSTTANMAPAMFVGTINPFAGATVLGTSAAGNAYNEMINAGYSKNQARNYAVLVGGSEAGLSYLLGGIGKLGGTLTTGVVDTLASKVSNIFAKVAIKLGGKVVSEAMEEGLQELLTPWFQQAATCIQQEKADWEDVAYAALLGGITALLSDGKSTVSEAKMEAAIAKMEKTMNLESAKPAELSRNVPEVKFTDTEIQSIQNIGRKSVNSFTEQDAAATEKLAQRYWEELGEKSPFYRAKNGDWRETEQTAVQIATKPDATRGVQKNADTGWDIQVSGKVFNETKVHTDSYNIAARAYLPYINDIVKNAVLLDSNGLDPDKPKSQNSLLMHSMYAVADIGKGPEVLKLYVEEVNDPNSGNTIKRCYQLQNTEKYRPTGKSSQKTASSISPVAGNNITVADLFAAVKAKDTAFQPKTAQKTANGKVGWDGRVVVQEAAGSNITVDGVTYKLLGLDENGSKVYQDVEVLKQQAKQAESKQTDVKKTKESNEKTESQKKIEEKFAREDVEKFLNDGKMDTDKNGVRFNGTLPKEKLTKYSLDPIKCPDKAEAFRKALGYDLNNYEDLMLNIKENIDSSKFVEKGDDGYGMRYEHIMKLKGPNGKTANVLTAWIRDGEGFRLTSVYITEKEAKNEN